MLEFWFDPAISRLQKFFILLTTLVIALGFYSAEPLDLQSIILFIATGVLFVICRALKQRYAIKHPTGLIYRLLTWIPIALLLALLFVKAFDHLLTFGIQGIAFMALAVFISSAQYLFKAQT